jgi:hypothetical protein
MIGTALPQKPTWLKRRWSGSGRYWQQRYLRGRDSGPGSYGRLAEFKAEVLNGLVTDHDIQSVTEFGCGDGNQLSLASYPRYTGLDVAPAAVEACRSRFADDPTRRFVLYKPRDFDPDDPQYHAELALSLDVIFHLTETSIFRAYMSHLFAVAERFVVIYSSNMEQRDTERHVRHRRFTDWVERQADEWTLMSTIPNRYPFDPDQPDETSFADFYIYRRLS